MIMNYSTIEGMIRQSTNNPMKTFSDIEFKPYPLGKKGMLQGIIEVEDRITLSVICGPMTYASDMGSGLYEVMAYDNANKGAGLPLHKDNSVLGW